MKTFYNTKLNISLTLFIIIILSATESFSQQVITFNDGTELKVFITYQTKDTVKYYLESQPQAVYIETMNHIDRISSAELLPAFMSDSLARLFYHKKYVHYKHMTIQGSILFPIGAFLVGLGVSGWVSASDNQGDAADHANGAIAIITVVGCAGVLSGIILLTNGIKNMRKYKDKMKGLSFDLRYTPQVKEISVSYTF